MSALLPVRNRLALSSLAVMGGGGKGAAPALPTAGLVARYIAGQGITTPGGAVTAWTDQAGTNNIIAASGTVTNPTVLGRPLVRFAPNSQLTLPASLSINNRSMSVFIVCRNYNQSTGIAPAVVFAAGAAATNTTLFWSSALNHLAVTYRDSANQITAIEGGYGITLLGASVNGSNATIIQGGESATTALGTSNTATGGFVNQFTGASPFSTNVDVYEIAIYNTAVSGATLAAVRAYYQATYGTQSVADTFLTLNGDSQTVAFNLVPAFDAEWIFQMASAAKYAPKYINAGVAGTTVAQMDAAASAAGGSDSYLATTPYTNKLNILDGVTNDVWVNGASASAAEASVTTYRTNRTTAGWATGSQWYVPMRPRGQAGVGANPAYEATRQIYNAWLVANFPSTTFSALLSHPAWSANDATNLTWYQADQTHMSIAGYGAQAQIQYAALKAAGVMA